MELPVELNKIRKTATITFAEMDDLAFIDGWSTKLGEDQDPKRRDAVEFAKLARHRFSAHSTIQPYAKVIADIPDYIRVNPITEVAGLILLKCDWFPDSAVIGLSHFRRTWCNNIILDYLAAHPFAANPPPDYSHQLRGVGLALLYFITQIAKECGCGTIWGEATENSWKYYKDVFKLPSVDDLIFIPRAKFIKFSNTRDLNWKKTRDNMPVNVPVLEEIYAAEQKNPPFVGSKTAMFNPPRTLANHFLDLSYHVQIEIAETLQLVQPEDRSQSEPELFRRIFQRAAETGKLSKLWKEVEKRHRDGDPDNNPFLKR